MCVTVTQKGFIMYGSDIYTEISEQLQQGKGCIVFDFGLYFPYKLKEGDKLIYKFSLGTEVGSEEFNDMTLNHRYPNKKYYTITKTYGRKLSKCGYPYFFDLKKDKPFQALLCLTTGYILNGKEESFDMMFNLQAELTAERPVCGLSLKQNFVEKSIEFVSYKSAENGYGYIPHYWSNELTSEKENDGLTLLKPPHEVDDKTVLFDTVIKPFAEKTENIDNLLLL